MTAFEPSDADPNLLAIPSRGLIFKLRPPHTVDSVRADAAIARWEKWPWLCRRGLHVRERIGDIHFPEDDLAAAAMVAVGARYVRALTRCRRCHNIQTRESF